MNYSKIEKFSVISVMIISFILIFIDYKYSLGMVLGGLASLLSFKMIQKLENVEIGNYKYLKSKLRRNHVLRYLIYVLVLLACMIRPNVFSYITCAIGLLITKIWIVIIEQRKLKEE